MIFVFADAHQVKNSVDWQTIGAVVAIVGVAGSFLLFVVSRIFKLGQVSEKIKTVESDVKAVKKDVGGLRTDLTSRIDTLMDIYSRKGLAAAASPVQLTEMGQKVLKSSGIDSIVDDKFEVILKKVKKTNPKNPYQAQQTVLQVVADLEKDPALKDAIEEGAFNSGYLVGSVLFVGGLYIRDRILKELGFKADDIDEHEPKKTPPKTNPI